MNIKRPLSTKYRLCVYGCICTTNIYIYIYIYIYIGGKFASLLQFSRILREGCFFIRSIASYNYGICIITLFL